MDAHIEKRGIINKNKQLTLTLQNLLHLFIKKCNKNYAKECWISFQPLPASTVFKIYQKNFRNLTPGYFASMYCIVLWILLDHMNILKHIQQHFERSWNIYDVNLALCYGFSLKS